MEAAVGVVVDGDLVVDVEEAAAASWASTGDGAATCGGGVALSRSSKSWARSTSGDGNESVAPIVEALFLALMAAARGARGVAIVSDDDTEIPVDGAVVDVETVAGVAIVPGVTVEEAACRAGVSR